MNNFYICSIKNDQIIIKAVLRNTYCNMYTNYEIVKLEFQNQN